MSSQTATHHEHGNGIYHLTLIALLILTAITVGASYIQFGSGSANVTIAMTIATIKATLVALFFMHLIDDKPMNAVICAAGFLFLGIFLLFCMVDFNTREYPSPRNMPVMEKDFTAVPETTNPLIALPPKPRAKAAKPAEAE
jgi:cytochrome c oxidase subunit IV